MSVGGTVAPSVSNVFSYERNPYILLGDGVVPLPAETRKTAVFYVKQRPQDVVEALTQVTSSEFKVAVSGNNFSVIPTGTRFLPRTRLVGTVRAEGYGSAVVYELKGRFSVLVPLFTLAVLFVYGACRLVFQMMLPANLESGIIAAKGLFTFLFAVVVGISYVGARRADERTLIQFVRAQLPASFDS